MTDLAAWPSKAAFGSILCEGQNVFNAECSANVNIKAGQVVGFAVTGVSGTLCALNANNDMIPIGVAMSDASSGQMFPVAGDGCIVNVVNCEGTAAIDAGTVLCVSTNALHGTVVELDYSTDMYTSGNYYTCGIAWDDIPGAGTGRMLVRPQIIVNRDSS